jgi:GTP pyrophosphokinase
MDWLNPDLGYVQTSRAKSKIRHWFRKQNRDKHIVFGRESLERELKRLGVLNRITFEAVAQLMDYNKLDDFLAAIGVGDITGAQISNRVLEHEHYSEQEETLLQPKASPSPRHRDGTGGIDIMGTGGLLVNLAKCCNPMPGDQIVGYITRGRGVTVHRRDCANVQNIVDTERLVEVTWGRDAREQSYSVPVEIIAYDREGLIRDISTVIADEQVNLSKVEVSTRQDIATLYLTMEIAQNQQLTRILNKIEYIPSVVEARRRNMT